jgi:hypothetical protein
MAELQTMVDFPLGLDRVRIRLRCPRHSRDAFVDKIGGTTVSQEKYTLGGCGTLSPATALWRVCTLVKTPRSSRIRVHYPGTDLRLSWTCTSYTTSASRGRGAVGVAGPPHRDCREVTLRYPWCRSRRVPAPTTST